MHRLQIMQGLEPSKINRDSGTLTKGASAPFLFVQRAAAPCTADRGPITSRRRAQDTFQNRAQGAEQGRRTVNAQDAGRKAPLLKDRGPLIPPK